MSLIYFKSKEIRFSTLPIVTIYYIVTLYYRFLGRVTVRRASHWLLLPSLPTGGVILSVCLSVTVSVCHCVSPSPLPPDTHLLISGSDSTQFTRSVSEPDSMTWVNTPPPNADSHWTRRLLRRERPIEREGGVRGGVNGALPVDGHTSPGPAVGDTKTFSHPAVELWL